MTNITKAMLDNALSTLEDKLKRDFQRKLEDLKTDLESKISSLETTNQQLKVTLDDLVNKQSIITPPPLFSSLLSKAKPAEFETKVLNAISAEAKEKSCKEKNIVIFGISESTKGTKTEKDEDDKIKIEEIFTALSLSNIKIQKQYRIKNSSSGLGKPSILVVELGSKIEQQQVIQESRNFNQINEYKNKVYINPDLTVAERASLKMLLTERNRLNKTVTDGGSPFRWVIRNDKLEKFKPKNLK